MTYDTLPPVIYMTSAFSIIIFTYLALYYSIIQIVIHIRSAAYSEIRLTGHI